MSTPALVWPEPDPANFDPLVAVQHEDGAHDQREFRYRMYCEFCAAHTDRILYPDSDW